MINTKMSEFKKEVELLGIISTSTMKQREMSLLYQLS